MAKILLIETSTALCSVALAIDGKVMASRKSELNRAHANLTAVYCDEVLKELSLKAANLDAVCISDGPGSYTGLRVGLSTAKGLCFGAGVKLLSVSSLDVLAQMAVQPAWSRVESLESTNDIASATGSKIIPMIDARRMEVYTARYDKAGKRISEIEAVVVDGNSYPDADENTIFIGDGALKCKDVIGKGRFVEAWPEASAMAQIAEKEYASASFRDVAYFEPFYLKEFVATTSKKKLF